MKTKQALVPKLRFGEFKQEWEKTALGTLGSYTKGFAFKSADYRKDGTRIVRVSDLAARKIKTDNEKVYLCSKQAADFGKWSINRSEIIITTVGSRPDLRESAVGRAIYVNNDGEGLLNQNMLKFRPAEEHSNYFTFSQLNTPRYIDYISDIKRGNANQANITVKDLLDFPLHTTTLPEQEKIAAFLTSVDDRIDQLKRKKSLLQDYKKGVMQKLFSQELRFKDDHGKPYPDWEEKKLGEVYTYQTTNSYSRDKLNYESGEVYNIHYGDIHTKFRCHFHLSNEYVPYLNSEIDAEKIKPESFLQVGDIVLADASEDYADIGKSIEVIDLGDAKVVAGLHTYILRPDTSKISKGFGAYLMQARPTRLEVMRIAQGTKVLGLPKAYLSFITLNIPHPDEQTKIANFLSTLDQKIEQIDTQITHTQTFKKGLLQQMFV